MVDLADIENTGGKRGDRSGLKRSDTPFAGRVDEGHVEGGYERHCRRGGGEREGGLREGVGGGRGRGFFKKRWRRRRGLGFGKNGHFADEGGVAELQAAKGF